jgi:lipid-A-disaccharide synthase
MNLYFVAGEASGDARAAEVMLALRALAPEVAFAGLGGPKMKALAGGPFDDWIGRAAVIGFIDVLRHYPFFKARFDAALEEILERRPDAVVFVDYPGFNLRLAKALRQRWPSARLIYYISPQVWAWNVGRIPRMARILDRMLCIFPFEQELYERSGLRTTFVGHPMVDALAPPPEPPPRDPALIGLFPGSRRREVKKIFPPMLAAAARIARERPDLRFEAAAASEPLADLMREIAAAPGFPPCPVGLRNAHDLMRQARAGMVASGTATLEAAFLRLPHVILYKTAWLTFEVGRRLVRVDHLGIANILARRPIVREFIQGATHPGPVAEAVLDLAGDGPARQAFLDQTAEVIAGLGPPGASRRAAEAILDALR